MTAARREGVQHALDDMPLQVVRVCAPLELAAERLQLRGPASKTIGSMAVPRAFEQRVAAARLESRLVHTTTPPTLQGPRGTFSQAGSRIRPDAGACCRFASWACSSNGRRTGPSPALTGFSAGVSTATGSGRRLAAGEVERVVAVCVDVLVRWRGDSLNIGVRDQLAVAGEMVDELPGSRCLHRASTERTLRH
jgi:hypothetical protein